MDRPDTFSSSTQAPKESVMDSMAPSIDQSSSIITGVFDGEKSTHEMRGGNREGRGSRSREGKTRGNSRGNEKGGGGGRGASYSRNKRSDMGRSEWSRNSVDKRARNEASQQASKRLKANNEEEFIPIYGSQFSKAEIDAEEKKPKRKVAVMIGYSGTGYKGMQLNHREKTIEGELFNAFVAAGAVSKANADDPKKSSLVRCARTDKGVHAAGNVISMKLIIEDSDIIQRINEKLSPQIRVFGMERTNGSFSAYQLCDSRIYEYLIPTHAFIPPHPNSYLGKKLVELAEQAGDTEGFEKRQNEVSKFWIEAEDRYIKPILNQLDPVIRPLVLKALYDVDMKFAQGPSLLYTASQEESEQQASGGSTAQNESENDNLRLCKAEPGLDIKKVAEEPQNQISTGLEARETITSLDIPMAKVEDSGVGAQNLRSNPIQEVGDIPPKDEDQNSERKTKDQSNLELAIRQLKNAYIAAKKAYRIHPDRLARVRSALSRFEGARNFHNYTIEKGFLDSSAKRFIKSFVVHDTPIIVNDTEWLSLKVHGQSFMMHQIRKMVSMAALVVRCGCHEGRLQDSYLMEKISIPKAPGLGLLLERPVFDTYNQNLDEQNDRKSIDFGKYETEMQEFKQKEIYDRIFREEERDNQFHAFFASIDNLKSPRLLYLSSIGFPATTSKPAQVSSLENKEDFIDESSSEEKDADG